MTALAEKLCESTSLCAANDNHSVDAEDGNYYNYFRDYDPTTGRYLQTDTIGQNGGLNLYKYAESNPLRYTDRRGQSVLDSILIIYFGFGSCRPSDPILNNDETADKPTVADPSREKNCQALKDSILETCIGLTGRKKFACFAAAESSYQQCMEE